MYLAVVLLLTLCVPGSVSDGGEGQPIAPQTLTASDLIIVTSTTSERLPLVIASRAARRGIRTYIAVHNASEAARLNALHGGPIGEHKETYFSSTDAGADDADASSAPTPALLHPLHRLGPLWALAPLLAHDIAKQTSLQQQSDGSDSAGGAAGSGTSSEADPPRPLYRWMLVARDDTLWLPRGVVRLLRQYNSGVAAAVSDHLVDFNGGTLLSPSPAAAVCLPCGLNLTKLVGRRRPPRFPQPACPVCRPAAGCEYRFDMCWGLAGGPHCLSKRFLGSGDRCSYSWVAGGAGMALSHRLLEFLGKASWRSCVRSGPAGGSTGERTLARCLWRAGFAVTHPAAGLAAGITREVFSDHHMLFGNPLSRQAVFGADANAALDPSYDAAAAAVNATPSAAALRTAAAAGTEGTTAAFLGALASTRVRPAGSAECDDGCRNWLAEHAVSAHLDVPYEPYGSGVAGAGTAAVYVAAAAGVMERAAAQVPPLDSSS